MSNPLVTVIMPCYNSSIYLAQAVQSVLDQTYTNFEFFIFDDGSTDGSLEILKEFDRKDNRIKLFSDGLNHGYLVRLNHGLSIASGKYIARMDSDDISLPTRFVKQVEYLERHPEVGVLGTRTETFTDDGRIVKDWMMDCENKFLPIVHLFRNNISHPTVFFRRSLIIDANFRYNPVYYTAEDYKAWVYLSGYTTIENFPEVLLKYRHHNFNIGSLQSSCQKEVINKVIVEQMDSLGLIINNQDELNFHKSILEFRKINFTTFMKITRWLNNISAANDRIRKFDASNLNLFCKHILSIHSNFLNSGFSKLMYNTILRMYIKILFRA